MHTQAETTLIDYLLWRGPLSLCPWERLMDSCLYINKILFHCFVFTSIEKKHGPEEFLSHCYLLLRCEPHGSIKWSPFPEKLGCGAECIEGVADSSRHSTAHHPGAEERGGLAVIPLLLKTFWRKTTCWSMAGGGENQHDSWIRPPSHYLGACDSKLLRTFLFPFFLLSCPSPLSTSIHCCLNSCPDISTQPTPLISVPSFVLSRLASRPHSINLLFPHFLSHGLTVYVSSTSCEPLTTPRPTGFTVWKLCDASPSLPILSFVLPGGPVALGKGCIPGWIPGCVVLISPEWPLHHYWGWLFCLRNFTTMPLAALTLVTWSLSPQQLMKEVW